MPTADVVVVGAGLSGLLTAIGLADRGASVTVVAKGHAATHWVAGPIDVAAPVGATTSRDGITSLAARPGHPYALLKDTIEPALEWFHQVVGEAGLPHVGGLDDPFSRLPTALGASRPVAIVPRAQAAALPAWRRDESLTIVGIRGFKDFWTDAIVASLGRRSAWAGTEPPGELIGRPVDMPGIAERHNLTALVLAERFDDRAWRPSAFEVMGRAVDRLVSRSRVGVPAVLGSIDHAAVHAGLEERLGRPVFEIPMVPPSVPGVRLYRALRAALRARGGRIIVGERMASVQVDGDRVVAVSTEAAARRLTIRTGALVLATGGIPGGGIVGEPDGALRETVLGLPVEGPPIDDWLAGDPLDPAGHPIEAAGIRTDDELRPIAGPEVRPLRNVRVVGALLAGQRPFRERCGDGVAIASAVVAAARLAGASQAAAPVAVASPR